MCDTAAYLHGNDVAALAEGNCSCGAVIFYPCADGLYNRAEGDKRPVVYDDRGLVESDIPAVDPDLHALFPDFVLRVALWL